MFPLLLALLPGPSELRRMHKQPSVHGWPSVLARRLTQRSFHLFHRIWVRRPPGQWAGAQHCGAYRPENLCGGDNMTLSWLPLEQQHPLGGDWSVDWIRVSCIMVFPHGIGAISRRGGAGHRWCDTAAGWSTLWTTPAVSSGVWCGLGKGESLSGCSTMRSTSPGARCQKVSFTHCPVDSGGFWDVQWNPLLTIILQKKKKKAL